MKRALTWVALGLLVAFVAGCGATSNGALDASLAALQAKAPGTRTTTSSAPRPSCGEVTASLRPPAAMPAPGAMPSGSYMAAIQRRGKLVAGVDQNTLLFAYFNPLESQLQGFEIDLARRLAQAIFGDPTKVAFKVITTDERIPAIENGSVDVVIDAMTITCARRQQVDFSTVYYDAQQRLLVPIDSPTSGVGTLSGKRVCATKGSTSIDNIALYAPGAIRVAVAQRTDCLVELQQGRIDAVTSDDSILRGFQAQDPYTKIVGPDISPQPYGMAINKAHPEFVRFVNGWLERLRTDGTWAQIYSRWLGRFGHAAPPTPHYSG